MAGRRISNKEARKEAALLEEMLSIPEVDYVFSNCVSESDGIELKRYFMSRYAKKCSVELRGSSATAQGFADKIYHLIIKKTK